MSNQFQPLADGEVVSIKNTYRVSELAAEIRSKVADSLAEWSDEHGVDGEALRFGSKGWEKGKVRLHLSIEFCPSDGAAQAATAPGIGSTAPSAPAAPSFSGGGNQMSAVEAAPQMDLVSEAPKETIANPIAAFAATTAMGAAATATVLQAPPKIESTIEPEGEIELEAEDENFDLGTMSEVTGEIDMQLSDVDVSGYVDFDLSDSLPEVSLDDLVSQTETARPSIIDEVWNEMSQPNWPGVSRV